MAKSKNVTNPNKKKSSKLNLLIYALLGGFLLYFAMGIGASIDRTVDKDGKPKIGLIGEHLNSTITNPSEVFRAFSEGGFALKMAVIAGISLLLFVVYKVSMSKKKLHRKGVEHGSAKWAENKEISKLADIDEVTKKPPNPEIKAVKSENNKPKFDENGTPLFFSIDNNIILTKEVKMSLNTRFHRENLNVLIIGGSGSGKTRFYAKPNLMQLNTSFVITDPKSEILQSTGKMFLEVGYELKVFNLIEMQFSHNYNPFAYVYDFEGNLCEDKVIKMIDVLMKNTKGDGDKDDFWSLSAQKLLTSIVFLLFEESEYNADFKDGKIVPETRDFSHLNMSSICEKLRKISYPADPKDVNFKSDLDIDFEFLDSKKSDTLASRYYKEFRIAPPETGQSIVATANARTQMFNLKSVADLTCCDTVHLETLGDKKTALFIIIPATSGTYNFLAAMMYTQLFDTLSERANFKFGGTLPVHVRCIMDEFSNIGQIPDFEKVIAFVRSMGMSLNVIIQNLSQLKARYEKTWEVIVGNCDSLLFLGGKEESTLKFVSESLGKETIDVETKNRTKGHKSNSTSESNSILGRELMTPSELLTMPITNCILMVRAFNPFYCEKYPIEKHPNFRLLEDFNKKNMFDKTCIKVKTQSDFERENREKSNGNNSENNNISEKTNSEYIQKIIDFTASQNVKSDVIKPVCEDFETYEEAEYYSENRLIFDTEIYADNKVFSVPSEIEYVDLGEPKSDFRSEIYGKLKGGDDNVENEKCDNKNAEKPPYIEDFSSEKIPKNYEEEDNFYDFSDVSDDMDTSENIAETFRKTSDITQNEELSDIFGLSIDRYLMSGF